MQHKMTSDKVGIFLIMHPVMLNYEIRNIQITIQHNFIKYSFSYMFRSLWGHHQADFYCILKEVGI